jgi:hypothetical protein
MNDAVQQQGRRLKVAFSRRRVERCFEDEKTELGFDHYEGRNYRGLLRHQALTAVTHLFLAEARERWRGEKPGADRLPAADGGRGAGAGAVAGTVGRGGAARTDRGDDRPPTATERQGAAQPRQATDQEASRIRHPTYRLAAVPVG